MKPPVNSPFRQERARSGLTHAALSKTTGLTQHLIQLAEYMVHGQPNPTLLDFFTQGDTLKRSKLATRYYHEQQLQRYNFGRVHFLNELDFDTIEQLRVDRLGVSKVAFCKMFCIPPTVLDRVENGKSRTLPEDIVAALRHAGCTEDQIVRLDNGLRDAS